MVSRTFVIVLALGAAAYRLTTGAVLEAGGLLSMALGLICLQAAPKKPALKSVAIACFSVTAAIIAYVLYRNSQ